MEKNFTSISSIYEVRHVFVIDRLENNIKTKYA